jgi:hypothetical protein
MTRLRGAMTLAEGRPNFRTDVDIAFGGDRESKDFVLRTTFDDIAVWKAKHDVSISGFRAKEISPQKWAAQIERDYWVFGIDATSAEDICAAVKIGMLCYSADAKDLLSNIYVRNLNAENENAMARDALVRANQKLYEGTCRAITGVAAMLGIIGEINFFVFSNNRNPKIPKDNLHMALRDGGATSIETDESNQYKYNVASNDGRQVFQNLISHMHLAKFRV